VTERANEPFLDGAHNPPMGNGSFDKVTLGFPSVNQHSSGLSATPGFFAIIKCFTATAASVYTTHTHSFNGLFFRDYPGKPVPER